MMGTGHLAALQDLLGSEQFLHASADLEPLLTDHRQLYHGRALGVALPRHAADVAAILRYCNKAGVGVVPQGGNTSYCGGATPDESGRQLLISLRRMNRVRDVDAANSTLVAEAGCLLATVQLAAAAVDRFFPLSLGSEGSCQIGGNLSTNAGGTSVLRYGMMRDLVLGLEVVLPDGRLLSSLAALRKDNTGYDIKSLFLGAEGTLGIITAACLKLFPAQRSAATAIVAIRDPAAALTLLAALRAASGDAVSSFELMPRSGVLLALQYIDGIRDPFDIAYHWYVLVELRSSRLDDPLDELLQRTLAEAQGDAGVADAVLAQNDRQRKDFWRLRELMPEAQRRHGYSLKHDISVPVSRLPEFLVRASDWVAANVPDSLLIAYGHAGDGNLHFNICGVAGAAPALQAQADSIKRVIHDLVRDFGGSFSAEHGIGRLKVAELERYAAPVELELMRSIKKTLDPNGIMNPGKLLAG